MYKYVRIIYIHMYLYIHGYKFIYIYMYISRVTWSRLRARPRLRARGCVHTINTVSALAPLVTAKHAICLSSP